LNIRLKLLFLKSYPKKFDNAELKKRLTPLQFHVTQEKGTERYINDRMRMRIYCVFHLYLSNLRPFSGNDIYGGERPFGDNMKQKESGDFVCVVCEQKLFSSKNKFESGSGKLIEKDFI